MSNAFINPLFYLVLRRDENGELSFRIFNSEEYCGDTKGVWQDISVDNRLLKYDDEDNELEIFVDSLIEEIGSVYSRMGTIYISFKGSNEDSEKIEAAIDRYNSKDNATKIVFINFEKSFSLLKSVDSLNNCIDSAITLFEEYEDVFASCAGICDMVNGIDVESADITYNAIAKTFSELINCKIDKKTIKQSEFSEKTEAIFKHLNNLINYHSKSIESFNVAEENVTVELENYKKSIPTLRQFFDKNFNTEKYIQRFTEKQKGAYENIIKQNVCCIFGDSFADITEDELQELSEKVLAYIKTTYTKFFRDTILPEFHKSDEQVYNIVSRFCASYLSYEFDIDTYFAKFSYINSFLPKLESLGDLNINNKHIFSAYVTSFGLIQLGENNVGVKKHKDKYTINDLRTFALKLTQVIGCRFTAAPSYYIEAADEYTKATIPIIENTLPNIDDIKECQEALHTLDELHNYKEKANHAFGILKNIREEVVKVKNAFFEATGGEQE